MYITLLVQKSRQTNKEIDRDSLKEFTYTTNHESTSELPSEDVQRLRERYTSREERPRDEVLEIEKTGEVRGLRDRSRVILVTREWTKRGRT